jgi:hypothetical protein
MAEQTEPLYEPLSKKAWCHPMDRQPGNRDIIWLQERATRKIQ